MATDLKFPRLNVILISGRVTRDAEIRYTPKGTPTFRFNMANDRSIRDESGNFQSITTFIDVVTWGKLAETCADMIHKGSPVIVQGRLEIRNYTDKDNQQRRTTEIIAESVQSLEFRGRSDGNAENGGSDLDSVAPAITDDDVPF